MSDLRVRMDPWNPGQFYACCGLLELAAFGRGSLVSSFEQDPGRPRVAWFQLDGVGETELRGILERLRSASSALSFAAGFETSVSPVHLPFGDESLELDWWFDAFRDKTTALKCWAGQVTTSKLFSELLSLLESDVSGEDVFQRSRLTKSKFGVDPRAAWNARDYGYSPNEHGMDSATFIAVEVLAAIGLQTFRPTLERRKARYYLWTCGLPLCVARNVALAPWNGLPRAGYQFSIGSRGQSYKFFRFGEPAVNKERGDES